MTTSPQGLRGRASEAARNDVRIHEAARSVLARNPSASVAEVASAAGVGRSALYLRYPSKEVMLQKVALDVTERYVVIIGAAHSELDRGADPRAVLVSFFEECLDADLHGFMLSTSGLFTPSEEDVRISRAGFDRGVELVARWHAAGVLREDATWNDINDWTMAICRLESTVPERVAMRRHRMLAVLLPGLEPGHAPLTGSQPIPEDYWPRNKPGFS